MRLRPSPDPGPAMGAISVGRWPVFLRALLAQVLAGVGTLASAQLAGGALPGAVLLLIHGALASGVAWGVGLQWWWLPIQFLFAPALLVALSLEIGPGWFLAGFVLLALVYWSTYRTRVPLYLSGQAVWQAIERQLPAQGRVADLGSGLGGPLAFLARRHPALRFEGIEAAPLPFLLSRLRAVARTNLRFRFGSFWTRSLGEYDLVFAYLSPAAMPRLWEKLRAEMRPGSTFVSVEFPVPGVEAHRVVQAGRGARNRLYVWHF